MKIKIKKNPNGDTRTAEKNVTFEQFQEANDMHINDVTNVMIGLSKIIEKMGHTHDWTKIEKEHLFYQNPIS